MRAGVAVLLGVLVAVGEVSLAAQPAARGAATNPLELMASAYRAADRAFQEGDYPLARALTIELTARFPTDAAVWLRLGQIEQALGFFGQSLAAFDRAIECETANPTIDGTQLAVMRYHRARLLVAEASNELAATSSVPLEERLQVSRAALRDALDMARANDPLLPRAGRAPTKRERPARGYVLETSTKTATEKSR
jgi:tetratricopeptide (TPR) repeat protein